MPPKTTSFQHSDQTHNLQEHIQILRQECLEATESIYLGDPHALERLTWIDDGRESYVAEKVVSNDGETPVAPKPILLSLIARITHDDTFIIPDGNYKGPSEHLRELSDLKLTVALGRVSNTENPILGQDFDNAYSVITKLRGAKVYKNTNGVVGVLAVGANDNKPKLKLRHKVFVAPDESDIHNASVAVNQSSENNVSEFELAGYPVRSPEAKEELATIVTKGALVLAPLPAFERFDITDDSEPHKILPSQYTSHVQGSLAVVHFFLTHTFIAREHKHAFSADVFSILVFDPPAPQSLNSPRKLLGKRMANYPFGSASKKAKGKGKGRA
ncbi:hypothetical protein EV360DRAFT_83945 [Lentinula raphanica]|nr:hypothetical protein EV360DRAFT_83945 [Lentinula raphanica]